MTDQITPQVGEPTENEVTLEDVYQQFNVSEPQPSAQPVQEVSKPIETPSVPDPYDTDAHKAYLARMAQGQTELSQSLQNVMGKLSEYERTTQIRALEEDINSAVSKINGDLGLKPKVVEAYLDAKAREDARFKAIWDGRKSNPKALDAALSAIKTEIARDFSVKVDPEVSRSRQALKASQQQMATTKQPSSEDRYSEFEQEAGSFDKAWERILNGQFSE